VTREIRVHADAAALAHAAAADVARSLDAAVRSRGCAALALAGGSTPELLYETLATDHRGLPWERVHVAFGDERLLPSGHADRNETLARRTLLDRVPVPGEHIHPVAGVGEPARIAAAYEEELRRALGAPESGLELDLVLLGLGPDGHTASLFPGDPALDASALVAAVPRSPTPPHVPRVTLTLRAIEAAREVIFLVAGESKREILRAVLEDPDSGARLPAARVRSAGRLAFHVDAAAAARLRSG